MSTGKERRAYERVRLDMLVQFRVDDMDQFMKEYASNISLGGMFIRTQQPRPEGANLYFQFRIGPGNHVFEGLGRVVHVNPADSEAPGMGVEFVNLDEASAKVLDEVIRSRAATPTP